MSIQSDKRETKMNSEIKRSKYLSISNKNLLIENSDIRNRIINKNVISAENCNCSKSNAESSEQNYDTIEQTIKEGTKKVPKFLSPVLKGLPERWKNWVVRGVFAVIMISAFGVLIAGGPLPLMGLAIVIQVKCFHEIMRVGFQVYHVDDIPWFRQLTWYLLYVANYFFYGEYLFDYIGPLNQIESLQFLIKSHRFISYCLYLIGFTVFVMLLVKKYDKRQFNLFAWAHVAIFITVVQCYLFILVIFDGIIWFLTPAIMIITNDIMAYIFGFFFGNTPLIEVSPKKTWEGFVGGAVATVIFGFFISFKLSQYPYFTCPVDYSTEADKIVVTNCTPGYLYEPKEYEISVGHFTTTLNIQPFVLHSFSISMFSSLIGPFAGFFASGFKRAFKIKDFGDFIPGHGGIMDRFDCFMLMGTFVYVYIYSFIKEASPQKLLIQIYKLKPEDQLSLYYQLHRKFSSR